MAEQAAEQNSELPADQAVKYRPVAVLTQVEKTYQLDSVSVPVIKGGTPVLPSCWGRPEAARRRF